MKCKLIILVFGFIPIFSIGQSEMDIEQIRRTVLKKSYIGLGGNFAGYQDAKFSNTQYTGPGGIFWTGTSRESENYYWNTSVSGYFSSLTTRQHSGQGFTSRLNWQYAYLRRINMNIMVGGKWDLADINFSRFGELGNNSNSVILNSTLLLSGRYTYAVKEDLKLNFDLGIGLFGVVKEGTSFAYSANQKVLEEGVFDFQKDATTSPFALSYYSVEPIGKFNRIQTALTLDYKKRWQLSYSWNMLNYRTVKKYPITIAHHTMGVRFNYIHKQKYRLQK